MALTTTRTIGSRIMRHRGQPGIVWIPLTTMPLVTGLGSAPLAEGRSLAGWRRGTRAVTGGGLAALPLFSLRRSFNSAIWSRSLPISSLACSRVSGVSGRGVSLLLMEKACLTSRIKQAGKWEQEMSVLLFIVSMWSR